MFNEWSTEASIVFNEQTDGGKTNGQTARSPKNRSSFLPSPDDPDVVYPSSFRSESVNFLKRLRYSPCNTHRHLIYHVIENTPVSQAHTWRIIASYQNSGARPNRYFGRSRRKTQAAEHRRPGIQTRRHTTDANTSYGSV